MPVSEILQSLDRHAASQPERPFIFGSSGTLNWQQLHREVHALATQLRGCRRLGVLMENAPAWIVTDLAAMQADMVNIPVPVFFSDEQLQHVVRDAGIERLITDRPERVTALLPVDGLATMEIAGRQYTCLFLSGYASDEHYGDTAKVTYTSGTTGEPRGVRLPLRAMETVAAALATAAGASRNDRALVLLPLSILLENIGSVYAPILAGAEIHVPDPAETGISGSSQVNVAAFARMLQRIRPSTLIVPPQLLKLLVALAKAGQLPDSFRFIAVGGAPTGMTLLESARDVGLPVYQGYGLSEACSVVAVNTDRDNFLGSAGRPLPHIKVRISEQGEILLAGDSCCQYLHAHAESPPEELATGDLGYLDDDGYLYVTGRCRERIITAYGRNVSPEWLESELISHPAIAQAALFGNNMSRLVAVLVPADSGLSSNLPATLEKALEEVNAQLPDYARVDRFIIAAEPFAAANGELSSSGSLRRRVIEEHYAERIHRQSEEPREYIL
jgi:long-subunit acyl-CoA synthetase (AMP-forming)